MTINRMLGFLSAPMSVYDAEQLDRERLSPAEADAALVADMRRDLTELHELLDAKDRHIIDLEARTMPPMKVVREYRCPSDSLVECVSIAQTLEFLGRRVAVKWARDDHGLIDGVIIAVVEDL